MDSERKAFLDAKEGSAAETLTAESLSVGSRRRRRGAAATQQGGRGAEQRRVSSRPRRSPRLQEQLGGAAEGAAAGEAAETADTTPSLNTTKDSLAAAFLKHRDDEGPAQATASNEGRQNRGRGKQEEDRKVDLDRGGGDSREAREEGRESEAPVNAKRRRRSSSDFPSVVASLSERPPPESEEDRLVNSSEARGLTSAEENARELSSAGRGLAARNFAALYVRLRRQAQSQHALHLAAIRELATALRREQKTQEAETEAVLRRVFSVGVRALRRILSEEEAAAVVHAWSEGLEAEGIHMPQQTRAETQPLLLRRVQQQSATSASSADPAQLRPRRRGRGARPSRFASSERFSSDASSAPSGRDAAAEESSGAQSSADEVGEAGGAELDKVRRVLEEDAMGICNSLRRFEKRLEEVKAGGARKGRARSASWVQRNSLGSSVQEMLVDGLLPVISKPTRRRIAQTLGIFYPEKGPWGKALLMLELRVLEAVKRTLQTKGPEIAGLSSGRAQARLSLALDVCREALLGGGGHLPQNLSDEKQGPPEERRRLERATTASTPQRESPPPPPPSPSPKPAEKTSAGEAEEAAAAAAAAAILRFVQSDSSPEESATAETERVLPSDSTLRSRLLQPLFQLPPLASAPQGRDEEAAPSAGRSSSPAKEISQPDSAEPPVLCTSGAAARRVAAAVSTEDGQGAEAMDARGASSRPSSATLAGTPRRTAKTPLSAHALEDLGAAEGVVASHLRET